MTAGLGKNYTRQINIHKLMGNFSQIYPENICFIKFGFYLWINLISHSFLITENLNLFQLLQTNFLMRSWTIL